jgi:hypothetical protein
LLVQARDILLIAREAIESFGDKNVKAACPGIFEHLLIAGAQGGGAADGMVRIDLAELPSLLLDPCPALADLILDRGVSLVFLTNSGRR